MKIYAQRKLVFLILLMALALGSCLQTENSSSGDGIPPSGSASFSAASSVFRNRCSRCHEYHQLDEVELAMTLSTTPSTRDQPIVVPGDPESSILYYRNSGSLGPGGPNGEKNMPFNEASLSAGELNAIYEWILDIQIM